MFFVILVQGKKELFDFFTTQNSKLPMIVFKTQRYNQYTGHGHLGRCKKSRKTIDRSTYLRSTS